MTIRKIRPYILALPSLLVCIAILIPFITAAYYSLLRYNLALPFAKKFIWFDNYIELFGSSEFWNTFLVSMYYTIFTVIFELLLGLIMALLILKKNALNMLLSVVLVLLLMVAPTIAGLIWKLLSDPKFGIFSQMLYAIGIDDFGFTSNSNSALFTVVLVDMWAYTPFMFIILLAGLRSLPKEPFEAALLDGIPPLSVFFKITLPMLMPFIITATLFRLLESLQQFDIIYAMTQGGPGDTLMVFQVLAYLENFTFTNIAKSSAILMVLWLITFIISKIMINYSWKNRNVHIR